MKDGAIFFERLALAVQSQSRTASHFLSSAVASAILFAISRPLLHYICKLLCVSLRRVIPDAHFWSASVSIFSCPLWQLVMCVEGDVAVMIAVSRMWNVRCAFGAG